MLAAISRLISNSRALPFGLIPLFYRVFIPERISIGVLPTFYHDQLREHKAAMEDLRQGFGERILPPIHRAAALAECPGESKTIFEKDSTSRSAQEYHALVDLVIKYS